jgi:putative ABC transport system permease protein
MKLIDLLQTASSNMLRAKARTFLTIIAIFIGATTITLTNGIGSGVKSYLDQQLGDLGATNVLFVQQTSASTSPSSGPEKYTYNPNSAVSSGGLGQEQMMLTPSDLAKIRATVPDITSIVPDYSPAPDYIAGTGDKYRLTLVQAFGASAATMVAGRGVSNKGSQNELTVPESYVRPLGYSSDRSIIGNSVTIGITSADGAQSTVTAIVTGVEQKNLIIGSSGWANTALIDQLNNIQNAGIPATLTDTFQTALATVPSNLSADRLNAIEQKLSAEGYTGQTMADEQSTIFTTVNAIIIVFDIFGVIALIAAAFGIINTLFMSVQERTKEIGLMRALGMSPRRIFVLFSSEAVLIGLWGSVLGTAFAALAGQVVNAIGTNGFLKAYPGLSLLTFPPTTVAAVIVGIMIIAFLAGTLPALRASRKDPIAALRYE